MSEPDLNSLVCGQLRLDVYHHVRFAHINRERLNLTGGDSCIKNEPR
jgi:hypothetical protein